MNKIILKHKQLLKKKSKFASVALKADFNSSNNVSDLRLN